MKSDHVVYRDRDPNPPANVVALHFQRIYFRGRNSQLAGFPKESIVLLDMRVLLYITLRSLERMFTKVISFIYHRFGQFSPTVKHSKLLVDEEKHLPGG